MAALAFVEGDAEQDDAGERADGGVARGGDAAEEGHDAGALHAQAQGAVDEALVEAEIRGRHRQHDQVGDDLVGDADRRGDAQLADHRDRDQGQRGEADEGGHQRHGAGDEQAAETAPRRRGGVVAGADLLGDVVDLLHAVGDADGEHQEGHQHGKRVEAVAEQLQRAELPDQRDQRAGHRQHGQRQRARVVEHRGGGEQEGQREELHHALGALGDVADLLGEADDLDLEAGVLVACADLLLQPLGEGQVVELLAALRVVLEEVGHHHGAAAVAGDQAAHVAADQGVAADARDLVRRELVGRDVAADDVLGAEALLRDLQPARGRRP